MTVHYDTQHNDGGGRLLYYPRMGSERWNSVEFAVIDMLAHFSRTKTLVTDYMFNAFCIYPASLQIWRLW